MAEIWINISNFSQSKRIPDTLIFKFILHFNFLTL